jgi:chaperonin cofactor prefoldin
MLPLSTSISWRGCSRPDRTHEEPLAAATSCELYPDDILALKARIEAKKNIYFSYFKLEVYGVKKIGDQRVSCLIGNLTLMKDVELVRGAVRTEDFELLMPKDVSPGIAYAIASTFFAEGGKTNELVTVILPGTYLYDVFTIAYLKDKAYEDLQKGYEDLQREAKKLSEDYEKLKAEFNEYKASHSYTNEEVEGLKKNYKELQSEYETLKSEVGIAKALNYSLIAIVVVLIATTAYLTIRRRNEGSPRQ